ncbi:hypothetical protein [Chryseobacterium jejuense]|uniref:hypothetical protein n=1 Tax=Chryseobacterium jejuense TaxID=445960 RepID=UPI001AE29DA5|nr:hypothetical protein [Chryseobacterium jejuense]MBP2619223.1 hypothetical protein [Chryseobacterium jejuense]
MKHSLFFFLSVLSIGCTNHKETKTEEQNNPIEYISFIESDTLKERNYIAVFDDNTNNKAELSPSELKIVNEYLIKAVNEYNEKEKKEYRLDLRNYFRQYSVLTDLKGEKIVKVFCFCRYTDDTWRNEKLYVHDGGDCYLNVNINITKPYHDKLRTHGIA